MFDLNDAKVDDAIRSFASSLQQAQEALQSEEQRLALSSAQLQQLESENQLHRQSTTPYAERMQRIEALRAEKLQIISSIQSQRMESESSADFLRRLCAPRQRTENAVHRRKQEVLYTTVQYTHLASQVIARAARRLQPHNSLADLQSALQTQIKLTEEEQKIIDGLQARRQEQIQRIDILNEKILALADVNKDGTSKTELNETIAHATVRSIEDRAATDTPNDRATDDTHSALIGEMTYPLDAENAPKHGCIASAHSVHACNNLNVQDNAHTDEWTTRKSGANNKQLLVAADTSKRNYVVSLPTLAQQTAIIQKQLHDANAYTTTLRAQHKQLKGRVQTLCDQVETCAAAQQHSQQLLHNMLNNIENTMTANLICANCHHDITATFV